MIETYTGARLTIPLMHSDNVTMPIFEEDRESILSMTQVTKYGPRYNRGVAENLGRYMGAVRKNDKVSSDYFLSQAAESLFDHA